MEIASLHVMQLYSKRVLEKCESTDQALKKMKNFQRDPLFRLDLKALDSMKAIVFEEFLDEVYKFNTRISTEEFVDMLSSNYSDYLFP